MTERAPGKSGRQPESLPYHLGHYRDLKRRHIVRLLSTYLAPLLILTLYFYFQYGAIVSEARRLHLRGTAENQANTLDLFLTERRINLANLADDPRFELPPSSDVLATYLRRLRLSSETFVDIGFFDSSGVQTAYAGPYPSLEKQNYSSEPWYQHLKGQDEDAIITDIYLGFRNRPHFTIAVKRILRGRDIVLRATLDPGKMYEYISSLEGSREVFTSIVNPDGYYQVVTEHIGTPLEASKFVPPLSPGLGAETIKIDGSSLTYAYSWLRTADWALIVQWASEDDGGLLGGFRFQIIAITLGVMLIIVLIIFNRARKLVEIQRETDETRAQLEHAAKLASVGELAAGIAHEINNPLAIISEEAGLIKDLTSPEFEETLAPGELEEKLDTIQSAAFRCRDITRKLLGFVRRTDLDLKLHDIHKLIDGVVDGLLGPEIAVSNIRVVREYADDIPELITDRNQLQQVVLNMLNNGSDAIGSGPGLITIKTSRVNKHVHISIADNGSGIARDQMDKLFMPFFTTKEVGRGTGLGLSVSYGIVKSLGGTIEVQSTVGKGSTFTIVLPVKK